MNKIGLVILLLTGFRFLSAQDPHFTQYYTNSLYLNPATSGTYSGSFRVSMLYRDQYFQPLEESYKTFAASGDVKLNVRTAKSGQKDAVSMGLTFLTDRVQIFDFNTNQLLLTLAYHKSLDRKYKQMLGIGFQGGLLQRAVNYENLSFQDQFNAIDGYTNATGEFLPPNNITVPDLSAGAYYSMSPSKKTNIHLGLAYQHFNQPNVSYYNDPVILNNSINKTSAYPSRFTLHGGVQLMTNYRLDISPRFIFLQQGKKQVTQLSTLFRFKFAERTGQYFHLGPQLRMVKDAGGSSLESASLMLGFEKNNFILGLSYDWGISSVIKDSRNFSTLEISLMYIGEYDNDTNFCPQF
jgi:type IX secretion system PorP/SprF family membrane protein